MKIYGLKNCDTCTKARKALPGADFVDVRADGMDAELRRQAFDRFGAALVNTRSTTWRGLTEGERQTAPLALLEAHPTLMKRPLIVDDSGAMHLGWGKDVQTAFGL